MSLDDLRKFKQQRGSQNLQKFKASQKPADKKGGFWNFITRNLTKPVASASNLLEDTGKSIGFGFSKMMKPSVNWGDAKEKLGINFLGHQADVWTGKNQRTYSDITKDIAKDENNPFLRGMIKTTGYGGDFALDPLNKVKLLSLTRKGNEATKVGRLGLSAAEQSAKGERALLQIGNRVIAKGDRVLKGSTRLNDFLRTTRAGKTGANVLSKLSTKIRPGSVSREDFKTITDAITKARNLTGHRTSKAIDFASEVEKILRSRKATDAARSKLLHAIEKGDKSLAPKNLEDLFEVGLEFKRANTEAWREFGGSVIEGHGLSHVATKEVADQMRKKALKGGRLFSPNTPQDVHRQWVKLIDEPKPYEYKNLIKGTSEENLMLNLEDARDKIHTLVNKKLANFEDVSRVDDIIQKLARRKKLTGDEQSFAYEMLKKANLKKPTSQIVNLKDEGIRYLNDLFDKGKGGFVDKSGKPVKIGQATAKEINKYLVDQGKKPIFQEDLPTVFAKMGISTGRKEAGTGFLEAVKGVKGEQAQKLIKKNYDKMFNIEAFNKAIGSFDKVQNLWKAQALTAPSYHVRNVVGNLWNNYLADTAPVDYFKAAAIQKGAKNGKLVGEAKQLAEEMQQHGVIGGGWYGKDITQTISDQVGKGSWNPLSQRFGGYRANKAIGETFENNARIAHYLSKRRAGFSPEEASKSVQKFLFDYGDLSWAEQNVLKRIMPFYTWTSKNIPLQIEKFVKNPGKFSKVAVAKKDIEANVEPTNEKYLSDYITSNAPVRVRKDKDGTTQYLLLGQWLPAAQAINFLSEPVENLVGMLSPAFKMPLETLFNKSSFFKNTLGEADPIEKFPGQTKNFLGLDLNPKTVNIVRSIRVLNELDKLNPGSIWGNQNKGSIWNKLGIPNASKKRGTRYSPDSTQSSRLINLFVGKTASYNPANSKYFYDQDTNKRASELKAKIKEYQKNRQPDLAKKANEELLKFLRERNGFNESPVQVGAGQASPALRAFLNR